MTKIIACIDGSVYAHSVSDHAAWAAARLQASVDLLHVLGRRDLSTAPADLSGSIAADAQQTLLEDLAKLDADRAKLIQKRGRMLLDEAKARIAAGGVTDVTAYLRHGDLLETITEREGGADLIVIGKRGEAADFAKLHLGSNLERVVRATHHPVLVASRAFRPIKRMLIAFDGGPSAGKAVEHVVASPLFAGLEVHLVMAGSETADGRRKIDGAAARIAAAGMTVHAAIEAGAAEAVIADKVVRDEIDLLVMGAYGHSRIRSLVIGSTTTEMLRLCKVPVILFR
ncbi:MAG: universal stress protein [Pseudolabrys sp.]|nr:universal stress protein [Pseudolabrys sp.]